MPRQMTKRSLQAQEATTSGVQPTPGRHRTSPALSEQALPAASSTRRDDRFLQSDGWIAFSSAPATAESLTALYLCGAVRPKSRSRGATVPSRSTSGRRDTVHDHLSGLVG